MVPDGVPNVARPNIIRHTNWFLTFGTQLCSRHNLSPVCQTEYIPHRDGVWILFISVVFVYQDDLGYIYGVAVNTAGHEHICERIFSEVSSDGVNGVYIRDDNKKNICVSPPGLTSGLKLPGRILLILPFHPFNFYPLTTVFIPDGGLLNFEMLSKIITIQKIFPFFLGLNYISINKGLPRGVQSECFCIWTDSASKVREKVNYSTLDFCGLHGPNCYKSFRKVQILSGYN